MRSDDPDPMNLKAGVLIMSDASVQQLEAATLRARIEKLEAALRTISVMDKAHEHDLFSATQVARAALEDHT